MTILFERSRRVANAAAVVMGMVNGSHPPVAVVEAMAQSECLGLELAYARAAYEALVARRGAN